MYEKYIRFFNIDKKLISNFVKMEVFRGGQNLLGVHKKISSFFRETPHLKLNLYRNYPHYPNYFQLLKIPHSHSVTIRMVLQYGYRFSLNQLF